MSQEVNILLHPHMETGLDTTMFQANQSQVGTHLFIHNNIGQTKLNNKKLRDLKYDQNKFNNQKLRDLKYGHTKVNNQELYTMKLLKALFQLNNQELYTMNLLKALYQLLLNLNY